MVKSIIKRIIVGVGIALVLMAIKGNLLIGAKAMTVNAQNVGSQTWSTTPTTDYWYVNKSINNYWYNWGPGYVYFNIGISKRYTDSVAPLVSPKSIVLSSGNTNFACSMGTNSVNNSTYVNQNYSVVCPVNFSNGGLTLLTINLMPYNNTPIDVYEIYFDGYMTFVNDSSNVNVNVDNSNNNSNRDQNFGNLINDNRANTNSINENNDNNTDRIIDSQQEINDTLNDDTVDDPSSDISDMNDKIASNSSVSQLLTLPIQLYQNILNSVNGSCSSFSLGSLYNHNLTLPCINLQNLLGSTLYGIIDILISGLFILSFRKKMVDIFNHLTSLNDRGNELE